MIVSLVPGYDACLSTNRRHGGALSSGSCSTFSEASSHLTTGTPDANGAATNMAASARFDVCPVPGCAAPDVSMLVSVSDVRCQTPATTACGSANAAGGADYSGELRAQLPLRITDRYNGPSLSEPATVIDTSLDVNIPCAGTAGDTAEGATCSIATKANAVVPSSVVAGQRAIWAIGQIGVFDGGADGNGDTTGDNEPFLRQGVFLP
jgi:hypothetical protein